MNQHTNTKKFVIIIAILLLSLLFINSVSADSTYKGDNLETIANGTVSGGLYSDSFYGFVDESVNVDYSNYSSTSIKTQTVYDTHNKTITTNTTKKATKTKTTTKNTTKKVTKNTTKNNVKSSSNVEVNFDDTNVTYVFKPLQSNVTIKSAIFVTGIYMGNMQKDYPVHVNLTFNNHQYLYKTLSSTYDKSSGTTRVDTNITRVTSDYLIIYDVTSHVKNSGNVLHLELTNSSFARVKMATLLIAYDDGDSDKINYIINLGHDAANEDDYVGTTTFKGLNTGIKIRNATLNAYFLASINGVYRFNDQILESSESQGGYAGQSTWDVTNYYKTGENNVLEYHKNPSAGYYKIYMSTLVTKYLTGTELPDLIISNVTINNGTKYNGTLLTDQQNRVYVTIRNVGTGDANNFNLTLRINNKNYTKEITSIPVDESKIILFDNIQSLNNGIVSVTAEVDPEKKIKEVNDTNNNYTRNVQVITTKYSDLNITSITVPSNIKIKNNTTITLNIKNTGLIKSANSTLRVYIVSGDNKTLLKTTKIEQLNVNATKTVKITWKPTDYGTYDIIGNITQDENTNETDYTNNLRNITVLIQNPDKTIIFVISDNSGVNSINEASKTILKEYSGKVEIQIRTNNQIATMSDSSLKTYLESSDIIIGDWISTASNEKINNILSNNNNIISNKNNKITLFLEPPVSTTASSANLMKQSVFIINGVNKISTIKNRTLSELREYYTYTARGTIYSTVYNYIKNSTLPSLFKKATLYKDMSNVNGYINMFRWLLNSIDNKTFDHTYTQPPTKLNEPDYGIYRDKWYSYLDNNGTWHSGINDYLKEHYNKSRPTVGLIESKMYVQSQQLQPYNAIISKLESLGLNVIPVVAFGGTSEQLKVMLNVYTNATSLELFISNSSRYTIRVDAIINMVAYGLGGSDFSNVTPFFEALNVPILKAIHSDYVTNAEYELGSTGLGVLRGDKWWHITIAEAQGAITPVFVGGYENTIDNNTGASISGYVPHEGNIDVLTKSVYNWILLKTLSNSEKKIALIYYNYPPGKQNIAASYLDPVESILNLLNILKDNGYNVQNIPSNSTILLAQMISQGTNVANWARGLVETMADFANSSYDEINGYQTNNTYKLDFSNMTDEQIQALKDTPGVLLYPVSKFREWYDKLDPINKLAISEGPIAYIGAMSQKAVANKYKNYTTELDDWYDAIIKLIPENSSVNVSILVSKITQVLKQYVLTGNISYYNQYLKYKESFLSYKIEGLSGWGEFPGNIMVVKRNNTKYFVLPGIKYGNVFIAPEPQRGWEGNAEQLYHNTIVPPHYQYLAFYSYLQTEGYNAMVFIGRHATHEWMSGKEVLCSNTDFTTILTGSIPQIYFYVSDGISEGLTAKRRGSAVIIDHLTPPMSYTSLYGNLSVLQSLASEYEDASDENKTEIIEQVKTIIIENNYEGDMGVTIANMTDDEIITAVNNYLQSMLSTMYPYGVHVLGENWSDNEIALLVSSMLSVEFEYNNAGETTTLLNELSLIYYNKEYSNLSSSKQSIIQEKSITIINELINTKSTLILNNLTSNPSEGLLKAIELAEKYIKAVKESTTDEIFSFLDVLNAGYIPPGTGDDPINNPSSLPTGKNFYQDQSTEVPTPSAYKNSEKLLNTTLNNINSTTKRIVIGIWDTETARDDGQLISLVLRLLGVEPVWTDSPSAGVNGKKLKETPVYVELKDLIRPQGWNKTRIDVTIILDGNFRDLYSRQVGLLDKAFRIALARSYYTILNNKTLINMYGKNLSIALNTVMETIGYYGISNETLDDNAIAYDWVQDFMYYISNNVNASQAGEYAINRIFAPPDNDYGALISQAVRQSWTFNDTYDLALKYLNRMSYIYSSNTWGSFNKDVLTRGLTGVEALFTSRNTNLYGIIDNDDYFDYWGGLYNLMCYLNNKLLPFNILIYGSDINPYVYSLEKYLNRELSSRYYNPQWIKAMMNESYAGAGYMSKATSNLYGWAWTARGTVKSWMWDNLVSVYVDDKYNIGVDKYLSTGYNSYAYISITGTLLTAAYDKFWDADEASLRKVANKWAQLVIDNGVACCDCSCGNIAMMDWSLKYINADLLSQFKQKLYQATQNKIFFEDGFNDNPNANGSDVNSNGTGNATSGGNAAGGVVANGTSSGNGSSSVNGTGSDSGSSSTNGTGSNNGSSSTNGTGSNSGFNNNSGSSNSTGQSNNNSTKTNNQGEVQNSDNINQNNTQSSSDITVQEQTNTNSSSSSSGSLVGDSPSSDSSASSQVVATTATVSSSGSTSSGSNMYELSQSKKGSAITESAMSFISVLFVLLIVGFITYGYYKRRNTS